MRLDADGRSTIVAALRAGVTVLDTARAYRENEALVAAAIAESGVPRDTVRVVTKCGMTRPEGAWVPDGRAAAILEDARQSAGIVGSIDLLLLHAPDPRVPLATSVRALERAREEGLARRIGLSNVNRTQLIEAERVAQIDAVEVPLGAFDDAAARGGLVRYCGERGIELLAHSPLGGPKKGPRLARDPVLVPLARELNLTPAELVLAYLLHLHPAIVPVAGARTPERAGRLPIVARTVLEKETLAALDTRFPALARVRTPPSAPVAADREVVMLMGIPGSGKSTAAARMPDHVRLNRDTMGGTLRTVLRALTRALDDGNDRVLLDNTYVTRASRNDVIETARRAGARVRCVRIDTPMHEAQVNVVLRILEKYGRLLEPDELTTLAKKDENLVKPTVLFRMARELEPPELDEGFAEIDVVPFERQKREHWTSPGVMVALEALDRVELTPSPTLIFGWHAPAAGNVSDRLLQLRQDHPNLDVMLCPHPAGPPTCWCRPPLPGLVVAFCEKRGVDPQKSVMFGGSPAHEAIARALGIAFRAA